MSNPSERITMKLPLIEDELNSESQLREYNRLKVRFAIQRVLNNVIIRPCTRAELEEILLEITK